MEQSRGFGVTALDFTKLPPKQRVVTGNMNIFIAKTGFVLIYFNKEEVQKVEVFSDLDTLLTFIRERLSRKGE